MVPDLLVYKEAVQDQDGIVPGGYVTYIVWDMVPGKPVDHKAFWDLDLASREAIRNLFRTTYQYVYTLCTGVCVLEINSDKEASSGRVAAVRCVPEEDHL